MSDFNEFVKDRERSTVAVDMEGYRVGLQSHHPTQDEARLSMLLEAENAMPGNIAGMIAAASGKPERLSLVPATLAMAKLRVAANGGRVANFWNPQSVLRQTALHMGKLGRLLQMALDQMPAWHGSTMTVQPAPRIYSVPAVDGEVKLLHGGSGNTFKAGVLGKGLRLSAVGEHPFGVFDANAKAQEDFYAILKTLRNGVRTKPRVRKMYLVASPSMRGELTQANREASVLRKVFIRPMPLRASMENTTGDVWAVRVDEQLLGLPMDGLYWPAEDEPMEIRHLELVKKHEE